MPKNNCGFKMTFPIPIDCLNDIIEYLEQDKISLRSCLFVNRLWCNIAVRILWKNVWNIVYTSRQKYVPFSIISTLVACLSNESKGFLCENRISIPAPTFKSLQFNYISFIKTLLFYEIDCIVEDALITLQINLPSNKELILQNYWKLLWIKSLHLKFWIITQQQFKTYL